jgi:hypothetical protein
MNVFIVAIIPPNPTPARASPVSTTVEPQN